MSTNDVSRRRFMRFAGGATVAASAAAQAGAAQDGNESDGGGNETDGGGGNESADGGGNESEAGGGNKSEDGGGNESEDGGGGGGGNEVPDFGSYLSDANGFDESSIQDARGEDSVTVQVGAGDGLAFDPAAVWVDVGATITWEWTGEGGAHNVVAEEGPAELESGDPVDSEGETYEFEATEDAAGITNYKCNPHEGQGMKGGIAVGEDVETVEVDTGEDGPSITIPDQALSLTTATFIAMGSTLGLGYFLMKFGGDYEQEQ